MKQLTFVLLIFLSLTGISQCPTGTVSLQNQSDVTTFAANYPNCSTVEGLYITGTVTDLTPLANITYVQGDVTIIQATNLNTLSGLENITAVTGDLNIQQNGSLTNLTGLNGLIKSGSLLLNNNNALVDCDGLQNFYQVGNFAIYNNPQISSFNGLNNLTIIGSQCYFGNLPSLTNISALSNLNTIGTNLIINSTPLLTSFSAFHNISTVHDMNLTDVGVTDFSGFENLSTIGGTLYIQYFNNLQNLNGLNALTSVGETASWNSNSNLTDISALANLQTVGGELQFLNHSSLTNLNGLQNLTSIGIKLAIASNSVLSNMDALNHSVSMPSLQITNNTSLSNCAVQAVCDFVAASTATIFGNAAGCASQTEVQNACTANITQLSTPYCGLQLTTFNEPFYCTPVTGATQYEFEFTDQASNVYTNIRPTYSNTLQIANLISVGDVYDVRLRAFVNGAWGPFGPICQLYAPATIPTTQLYGPYCGLQTTTFDEVFYTLQVIGATSYDFRFSDLSGNVILIDNRPTYSEKLSIAGLMTLGVTYNVDTRAYINGQAGPWGAVCQVHAPTTVPTTSLYGPYCGIQTTTFNQPFYTTPVNGASSYDFRFSDLSGIVILIHNRPNYADHLSLANLFTIGATYNVDTRAYINGTAGAWGTVCQVHAPTSVPTTSLYGPYCGINLTSYSQAFYTTSVHGATSYDFEFSDLSGNVIMVHNRPNYAESLNLAGLLSPNVTYSVRTRAYINGSQGTYGAACTVTSPSTPPVNQPNNAGNNSNDVVKNTTASLDETSVNLEIFPNPTSEFFTIRTSLDEFDFEIYAMNGQLVYQEKANSGNTTVSVSDLESGVYSILIFDPEHYLLETKKLSIVK